MRIVIDLQGAQGDNRFRGIGRYSLEFALGVARNRGGHEVLITLNGHFRDTIEDIRAAFNGVLPPEAIRVWTAPGPLAWDGTANERRRQDAELLREAFLASLEPDAVVVTSLFEGLADDVVTSVGRLASVPTAVVLYDLIPLLNEQVYLANDVVRAWYHEKLGHLRRADQLLSISQSAAEEAVTALGWDWQRVANISTAAAVQFRKVVPSTEDRNLIMQRYSLSRDYLMYTGGIDPRKNIEGLIRAFARLPAPVRQAHRLAIVCKASEHDKARLAELAASVGLTASSVVVTGFVPDEDLVRIYNGCKAFVFPSLHEGFGLPALEAMQCGRAVIASNTSSLPEVVGCGEALFDPRDEGAIAAKIERVLTDDAYRARLEAHGLSQARNFSWDATAIRAIEALEATFGTREQPLPDASPDKPRLAFISPLPPERSGIADYSADLLPALAEHYQIDIVIDQDRISDPWIVENLPVRSIDWFRRNAGQFDRVLYHFGNSPFHEHMFELLETIPGVVVLHDFFLSGIQLYRGVNNWMQSVLCSHGVEGLAALAQPDVEEHGVWVFPGNLSILQNAAGIIVHSEWSKRLAEQWYGADAARDWAVVPLLRRSAAGDEAARVEARRQLGLSDDELVICSFGDVTPNKLTIKLVEAFASAVTKLGPRAKLVLVGRAGEDYSHRVEQLSRTLGLKNQVEVTGWVDADTYHRYQQAADIAVQLRTMSRGETSAAALDCMKHGLPLVANANGAMAELDPDAVWLIPDEFEISDLARALVRLAEEPDLRKRLGSAARALIADQHAPARAAQMYRDAIEAFNTPVRRAVLGLSDRLALSFPEPERDRALASALASSFPPRPRKPSLFIDVSYIAELDSRTGIQRVTRAIMQALLSQPHSSFSIVPVRRVPGGHYVVALRFCETMEWIPTTSLAEEPVDAFPGDIFLGLDLDASRSEAAQAEIDRMRAMGVKIVHVVYDLLPIRMPQHFKGGTVWFRQMAVDGRVVRRCGLHLQGRRRRSRRLDGRGRAGAQDSARDWLVPSRRRCDELRADPRSSGRCRSCVRPARAVPDLPDGRHGRAAQGLWADARRFRGAVGCGRRRQSRDRRQAGLGHGRSHRSAAAACRAWTPSVLAQRRQRRISRTPLCRRELPRRRQRGRGLRAAADRGRAAQAAHSCSRPAGVPRDRRRPRYLFRRRGAGGSRAGDRALARRLPRRAACPLRRDAVAHLAGQRPAVAARARGGS